MRQANNITRKLAVLSPACDGTGTHTAFQASAVPGMKAVILGEAPPALAAPDVQALASWAADTANTFKSSSGLNGQPELTCNAKTRQRSKSMPQRLNNTPNVNYSGGRNNKRNWPPPQNRDLQHKIKTGNPRGEIGYLTKERTDLYQKGIATRAGAEC